MQLVHSEQVTGPPEDDDNDDDDDSEDDESDQEFHDAAQDPLSSSPLKRSAATMMEMGVVDSSATDNEADNDGEDDKEANHNHGTGESVASSHLPEGDQPTTPPLKKQRIDATVAPVVEEAKKVGEE